MSTSAGSSGSSASISFTIAAIGSSAKVSQRSSCWVTCSSGYSPSRSQSQLGGNAKDEQAEKTAERLLGSAFAARTPSSTPTIAVVPMTAAARQRTLP